MSRHLLKALYENLVTYRVSKYRSPRSPDTLPQPPTTYFRVQNSEFEQIDSDLYLRNVNRNGCVEHCHENPIDVFLFGELPGLNPNFHIHVSVSDLYISRIGPHISCNRIGRLIVGIYKWFTDRHMNVEIGTIHICFEFSILVFCKEDQSMCVNCMLKCAKYFRRINQSHFNCSVCKSFTGSLQMYVY